MAAFLIDYENIAGGGLKGTELLNETDNVILFYSASCPTIRRDEMEAILNSGCRFKIVELQFPSKNGLDFYIASEAGSLAEAGERLIEIISNDNGFQAVIDYLNIKYTSSDFRIHKSPNFEKAISGFDSPADMERRSEAYNRMQRLNLAKEFAKYEERNAMKEQIRQALMTTEYESRIPSIIDFVFNAENLSKREFYTETLHTFGKNDGLEIYRKIKDAV